MEKNNENSKDQTCKISWDTSPISGSDVLTFLSHLEKIWWTQTAFISTISGLLIYNCINSGNWQNAAVLGIFLIISWWLFFSYSKAMRKKNLNYFNLLKSSYTDDEHNVFDNISSATESHINFYCIVVFLTSVAYGISFILLLQYWLEGTFLDLLN